MVTLTQAETALKNVYLEVVSNQLNDGIDPFIASIEKTTKDVWGTEILIPTQIWYQDIMNNFNQSSPLASIYLTIELSDKAIRVAENNIGAFVDLLNSEVESMLAEGKRRIANAIYSKDTKSDYLPKEIDFTPIELNSLADLFDTEKKVIYGIDRTGYFSEYFNPQVKTIKEFNPAVIEQLIDEINPDINFLICSPNMKRVIQQYYLDHNQQVERKEDYFGYNLMEFNSNVSILPRRDVADNEMWLVSSKDFTFNQLADWCWLSDSEHKILLQEKDKPVYKATLAKYMNLMCHRIDKQIKIIIEE